MQSLNRVNPERFSTNPLSPGAVDERDLLSIRGRLGQQHRIIGPDLRSRVTRFGQGVAYTAPHVFTVAQTGKAAPTTTAKPIVVPPPIGMPTRTRTLTFPGLPPVSLPFPVLPTPQTKTFKVGAGGAPPASTGGPSSPTTAGAPPVTGSSWSPGTLIASGGGITDPGLTPAPLPSASASSDGGSAGGLSGDFTGAVAGPETALRVDYTMWALVAAAGIGLYLLGGRRRAA